MAREEMPYAVPELDVRAHQMAPDHRQGLLLRSGLLAFCSAASIVFYATWEPSASRAHAFVGFLLLLLGVLLVTLALVARGFPRAARLGAAAGRALLRFFFGM